MVEGLIATNKQHEEGREYFGEKANNNAFTNYEFVMPGEAIRTDSIFYRVDGSEMKVEKGSVLKYVDVGGIPHFFGDKENYVDYDHATGIVSYIDIDGNLKDMTTHDDGIVSYRMLNKPKAAEVSKPSAMAKFAALGAGAGLVIPLVLGSLTHTFDKEVHIEKSGYTIPLKPIESLEIGGYGSGHVIGNTNGTFNATGEHNGTSSSSTSGNLGSFSGSGQLYLPGIEGSLTRDNYWVNGTFDGLQITDYSTGNITTYESGNVSFFLGENGRIQSITLEDQNGEIRNFVITSNGDVALNSQGNYSGTNKLGGPVNLTTEEKINLENVEFKIGNLSGVYLSMIPDGPDIYKDTDYQKLIGAYVAAGLSVGAIGASVGHCYDAQKSHDDKKEAENFMKELKHYLKDTAVNGVASERIEAKELQNLNTLTTAKIGECGQKQLKIMNYELMLGDKELCDSYDMVAMKRLTNLGKQFKKAKYFSAPREAKLQGDYVEIVSDLEKKIDFIDRLREVDLKNWKQEFDSNRDYNQYNLFSTYYSLLDLNKELNEKKTNINGLNIKISSTHKYNPYKTWLNHKLKKEEKGRKKIGKELTRTAIKYDLAKKERQEYIDFATEATGILGGMNNGNLAPVKLADI